ncbi:MAG: (2Fe-2S)-binding protein [Candidatus Omnitrophica bacterium]|nr:(2Fe-2S)-binding protein [Candidatus Omnitrophota bacterium]
MKRSIQFNLNGKTQILTVEESRKLLWVIRSDLGLTGCKYGCGRGYCGACTVLVNNRTVRSCIYPISFVDGKEVVTIEGLAKNGKLHPLQKAFVDHDASQCGYCSPGMILTAYTLLLNNKRPSYDEIIHHMDKNLCRCGSHTRIVRAIQAAAREMNTGELR